MARLSALLAVLLSLALPHPARLCGQGKTLEASLGDGTGLRCAVQSTFTPGSPRTGETVVVDRVANHLRGHAAAIAWSAGGTTFKTTVPPAVRRQGKVVPGMRTQVWNTFRAADQSLGQIELTVPRDPDQDATFTAVRWTPSDQAVRARPGRLLFAKLFDGDEKGKELVGCACVVRQRGDDSYEYEYVVTNSSASPVKFEWAGFAGTVAPGKSFRKAIRANKLTVEKAGTARFVFKDGTKHAITANVWQPPE